MYENNPRELCIKMTYLNRGTTNYFIFFNVKIVTCEAQYLKNRGMDKNNLLVILSLKTIPDSYLGLFLHNL